MSAVERNVRQDPASLNRKEALVQAPSPVQSSASSSSLALLLACSSGIAKGAVYVPVSKKTRPASPTYLLLQISYSVARIQSKNTYPRCRKRLSGIRTRSPLITTTPLPMHPNARCRGTQQLLILSLTPMLTLNLSKPLEPKEQTPSLSPLLILASPTTTKLSTTERLPPSALLALLKWITIWTTLMFPTILFVSQPKGGTPFDPAPPAYRMQTGSPI